VHTKEEDNISPPKGRKALPGEQIAYNRTMHGTIQLFENEAGEYYPVIDWDSKPNLVRGEYYPIGNRMQFPKVWGRKYGATKLLEYILTDKKKQLEDAKREIAKLERCLSNVTEWPEYD
jgi:hypothetical protein